MTFYEQNQKRKKKLADTCVVGVVFFIVVISWLGMAVCL